jgi:hypothetical protein
VNSDLPSSAATFRIRQVRLYLSDEEFSRRVGTSTAELAAYLQTLVWVADQYFSGLRRDFGSLGVLIAVGIKPERRIKLWLEVVGGQIPHDVWSPVASLLDGAGVNVWPLVTAPVALAIDVVLGNGPASFPDVPTAWSEAARTHGQRVAIPEGIFELLFP